MAERRNGREWRTAVKKTTKGKLGGQRCRITGGSGTWGPARENGGGGEELEKSQPNPNSVMAGVGEGQLSLENCPVLEGACTINNIPIQCWEILLRIFAQGKEQERVTQNREGPQTGEGSCPKPVLAFFLPFEVESVAFHIPSSFL